SFLFHAPPPTYLYTLSLHDALPIYCGRLDAFRRIPAKPVICERCVMLGIDIPIDLGKKNELVSPAGNGAGEIRLQRKSVVDSGGIPRQNAAIREGSGLRSAE